MFLTLGQCHSERVILVFFFGDLVPWWQENTPNVISNDDLQPIIG